MKWLHDSMKMMKTADESELGVLNFACLFRDRLLRSANAILRSGRNSSSPSRLPDIINQGSRHRAGHRPRSRRVPSGRVR